MYSLSQNYNSRCYTNNACKVSNTKLDAGIKQLGCRAYIGN